jgi:hypothetical protein
MFQLRQYFSLDTLGLLYSASRVFSSPLHIYVTTFALNLIVGVHILCISLAPHFQ